MGYHMDEPFWSSLLVFVRLALTHVHTNSLYWIRFKSHMVSLKSSSDSSIIVRHGHHTPPNAPPTQTYVIGRSPFVNTTLLESTHARYGTFRSC